jgi:hypothetical protein
MAVMQYCEACPKFNITGIQHRQQETEKIKKVLFLHSSVAFVQ